ncbi:NAD-binding protein [Mucidula mucida]|nr:NAD-binding protein [Mucidula mucida]
MGSVVSMYAANWPPKAKWSVDDIPDLSGKVIIVTGGNSGIGDETVYIASHDKTRVDTTIQALKSVIYNEALFIDLDLASLRSVKAAAETFQKLESKLDVLINNAGVMIPDPQALTAEGYDLQFGVNVVGKYIPLLMEAPAAGSSRVVTLTSHGHVLVNGINWDTIMDGPERRNAKPLDLYNQSKFTNIVVADELARRYADKGIVSTQACLIVTNLGRTMSPTIVKIVGYLSYNAAQGALTSLWAATSPETADYLVPWVRIGSPHVKTSDPELGTMLWNWLEEQIKDVK